MSFLANRLFKKPFPQSFLEYQSSNSQTVVASLKCHDFCSAQCIKPLIARVCDHVDHHRTEIWTWPASSVSRPPFAIWKTFCRFFCRAQVKYRSSYNSDCETGIRVTFQLFTRANKYYLLITRKRTPDPIINIHSLFTVLRINYLTGQRLARNMFRNWFYFFLLFLFRNMKVSRNSLKLCFETIKIFGK